MYLREVAFFIRETVSGLDTTIQCYPILALRLQCRSGTINVSRPLPFTSFAVYLSQCCHPAVYNFVYNNVSSNKLIRFVSSGHMQIVIIVIVFTWCSVFVRDVMLVSCYNSHRGLHVPLSVSYGLDLDSHQGPLTAGQTSCGD